MTKLGDMLRVLDRHVDFAALEAEVDQVTSRPGRPPFPTEDGAREARLAAAGWRMFIQRKGGTGKPLSPTQEQRTRRIAQTRARVEHVFAGLAQMGQKTMRSIGLARATPHLNWNAAAYNLQRLCYLKQAQIEAF